MNTKGWDIVSFTSTVHLNSAIHDTWKEENAFFDIVSPDYSLHGKFDIWNVVDGGGGRYIRMELPVTKAVFSVEGREDMDLSGMVIAADVMLNFFESADSEKNAGRSELKFDFKRVVSPTKQAEAHSFCNEEGGFVLPISIWNISAEAEIFEGVILESICQYLVDNPHKVNSVFANITYANGGSRDWLKPVHCAYSYLDGKTKYLAIMAVCTERTISDLPLDIDISGIDKSSGDTFFVISSEWFLKNVITNTLAGMFRTGADAFFLSGDRLTNNRRVSLPSITVGAIDYDPHVSAGGVAAYIAGSSLSVNLNSGYCDLYLGITMSWLSLYTFQAKLESGNIRFETTSSHFSHSEDIPWYLRFIPLSFIIDICVACISDSLAGKISISGDITTQGIDSVKWYGTGAAVKAVTLHSSLILRY